MPAHIPHCCTRLARPPPGTRCWAAPSPRQHPASASPPPRWCWRAGWLEIAASTRSSYEPLKGPRAAPPPAAGCRCSETRGCSQKGAVMGQVVRGDAAQVAESTEGSRRVKALSLPNCGAGCCTRPLWLARRALCDVRPSGPRAPERGKRGPRKVSVPTLLVSQTRSLPRPRLAESASQSRLAVILGN